MAPRSEHEGGSYCHGGNFSLLQVDADFAYTELMNDPDTSKRISRFVKRLLPDASLEAQLEAQANVDHFVSVLYRLCDDVDGDDSHVASDKNEEDAILNTSTRHL